MFLAVRLGRPVPQEVVMSDEETLFESEQQLSVAAVARRLREVAEGLEAGALQLGGHTVTPASTVKFEEEYSAESTDEGITFELELELKWNSPTASGRRSTTHEPGRGRPGWLGSSSCSRTSAASSDST